MKNKFRDPVSGLKYLSREVENIIYAFGMFDTASKGLRPDFGIKVGSTKRTFTERYMGYPIHSVPDGGIVLVGAWAVPFSVQPRKVENWFHNVLRSADDVEEAEGEGRERFATDITVLAREFGAPRFKVQIDSEAITVETLFLGTGLVGAALDNNPGLVREMFSVQQSSVVSASGKTVFGSVAATLALDGVAPNSNIEQTIWEFINKVDVYQSTMSQPPSSTKESTNGDHTKDISSVCNEIVAAISRNMAPMSRAQLLEKLPLPEATLRRRLADLASSGVIVEVDLDISTPKGPRKAKHYKLTETQRAGNPKKDVLAAPSSTVDQELFGLSVARAVHESGQERYRVASSEILDKLARPVTGVGGVPPINWPNTSQTAATWILRSAQQLGDLGVGVHHMRFRTEEGKQVRGFIFNVKDAGKLREAASHGTATDGTPF